MNQLLADIEKAFLLLAECTHNVENCRASMAHDKFLGEFKQKNSTTLSDCSCRLVEQIAAAKEAARGPLLA